MKKQRFSRVLSAVLAILILTQTMCLSAFAAETTTVVIPEDSDVAAVNEILSAALLEEDNDAEWEYYCVGKNGLLTNKGWGSIAGFTTEKKVVFTTTTYTHPALAANDDGEYQVRVASTGDEYTIKKLAEEEKPVAEIELNESASATLVYNADNSLNVAATEAAVFEAAVVSSDPELTVEDVEITYYATATTGAVGDLGKAWMPLEGGKKNLVNYPAISAGEQQIRITWAGNNEYQGFEKELVVTMADRAEAPYELNDPIGSVKLTYQDDMTVNYDKLYADVFEAVVAESEVLALDNVTITYYAVPVTGTVGDLGKNWMPLEGGKKNLVDYSAISAGEQKVRISWPGSEQYAPATIEVTVSVADRDALQFNLNEGPYEVGMVFNAEQGYDYDATAAAIVAAVLESTEPQVSTDEITVEYNAGTDKLPVYKALDNADLLTKKFGEGTWSIKLSWAGNQEYAGNSVTVQVAMTDSRVASEVVLKDGVSFTYNKDVAVIKQAIFDRVIDWENSDLPAKETLSVDDFTFTYKAQLSLLDGAAGDAIDGIVDKILGDDKVQTAYVPFEGKTYEALNQVLGGYDRIGAGVQDIKVVYNGNADYKPSAETEGTVTINKASVKVSVKSASMYISEAQDGLNLVSTNPVDDFDTYVIYAGITSNVTVDLYLQMPAKYTENKTTVKVIDGVLAALGQPTLTEMMQNGITFGELRELLNAAEVVEALEKLGIDTGSFGQIIAVINKLPSVGDNIRIGFGVPARAGVYTVTAVTDSKNYNTGVGVGGLVLKADKATLVWNENIGSKLTAEQAQAADFGATLTVNGQAVKDQSSIHVLYSGLTSKWKLYSSTTTAPTDPGRYSMTVVVLGGNYLATPITRTFQITK